MVGLMARRLIIGLAFAAVGAHVAAVGAAACSTGYAPTASDVGGIAEFIVKAEVVAVGPDQLNYRLAVLDPIRGDVHAKDVVTIGPRSRATAPADYPDCWLLLPTSGVVVVALSDRTDLNALTSWAWWEEDGNLVTASAVAPGNYDLDGLAAELRAGARIPPTDTIALADDPQRFESSVAILFVAGVATIASLRLYGRRGVDKRAMPQPLPPLPGDRRT